MKKKGFYLLPIVKLLDSYKVYSIIKVDPCGEVSWNLGSPVFFMFFQCRNHNHNTLRRHSNPQPPLRPPCVIYSVTHSLCCSSVRPSIHPSLSLLSSLPLSIRSGTTSSLVRFLPFSSRFFHLFYFIFCFECLRFLFVRSPPTHPPPPFQRL